MCVFFNLLFFQQLTIATYSVAATGDAPARATHAHTKSAADTAFIAAQGVLDAVGSAEINWVATPHAGKDARGGGHDGGRRTAWRVVEAPRSHQKARARFLGARVLFTLYSLHSGDNGTPRHLLRVGNSRHGKSQIGSRVARRCYTVYGTYGCTAFTRMPRRY